MSSMRADAGTGGSVIIVFLVVERRRRRSTGEGSSAASDVYKGRAHFCSILPVVWWGRGSVGMVYGGRGEVTAMREEERKEGGGRSGWWKEG